MDNLSGASSLTGSLNTRQQALLQKQAITCAQASKALEKALTNFWGFPLQVRFFSLTTQNPYYCQLDDFYVTQREIVPAQTDSALPGTKMPTVAQLRLSQSACARWFANSLEAPKNQLQSANTFRLKHVTPFEVYLLNECGKTLLGTLSKHILLSQPAKHISQLPVYGVWLVQPAVTDASSSNVPLPEEPLGKILLTVPMAYLKPTTLTRAQDLPDEAFGHAHATVNIALGSGTLRIGDIKHLEKGDIVVLDQSHSNQMHWVGTEETEEEQSVTFQATIKNRQRFEVTEEGEPVINR